MATNNYTTTIISEFNKSLSNEQELLNSESINEFNNVWTDDELLDNGINLLYIPRTIGEIPLTSNFELLQSSPLDARTVVKTENNLYSQEYWLGKANNNPVYLYKGMLVTTMDTGKAYIYTGGNIKISADDTNIENYINSKCWNIVTGSLSETYFSKSKITYTGQMKLSNGLGGYNYSDKIAGFITSGYILSNNQNQSGAILTDYYTMVGSHSYYTDSSTNFYDSFNFEYTNTSTNNVIHNFTGIYVPNKTAKALNGKSLELLNAIVLQNMNNGRITLLTVNMNTSSATNEDESNAEKTVLNLDTSLAEMCIELDVSTSNPHRAGIKITRDSQSSNTVTIDASNIVLNADTLYPWQYISMSAPDPKIDNTIPIYNISSGAVDWVSITDVSINVTQNNTQGSTNNSNSCNITDTDAYDRYVAIANTKITATATYNGLVGGTLNDNKVTTNAQYIIKLDRTPNFYIRFNGNINDVYSIDADLDINLGSDMPYSFNVPSNGVSESINVTISDYLANNYNKISNYYLNINNYKLGNNGLNTSLGSSKFNLPIGIRCSYCTLSSTSHNGTTINDYTASWYVTLYLYVPQKKCLEYSTYSESWNNKSNGLVIDTLYEDTDAKSQDTSYLNVSSLYEYSYDAGIIGHLINSNSKNERIDNISCGLPTNNYTVEYPLQRANDIKTSSILSLSNLSDIPWEYYTNAANDGFIRAKSIDHTQKVDFFVDFQKLNQISGILVNDDLNTLISYQFVENGNTANIISLLLYIINDMQLKMYTLNTTVTTLTKIVANIGNSDNSNITIDTTNFATLDQITSLSKNIDNINNDVNNISNHITTINTSIDDIYKDISTIESSFNGYINTSAINSSYWELKNLIASNTDDISIIKNTNIPTLNSSVNKNTSNIVDISNRLNDNYVNTSTYLALTRAIDTAFNNIDSSITTLKNTVASMDTDNLIKRIADVSLLVLNTSNNLANYKTVTDSSIVKLRQDINDWNTSLTIINNQYTSITSYLNGRIPSLGL